LKCWPKQGVPAGVNVAPVIPGLTDQEMLSIVEASVTAGAQFANYTVVRLPYAVKDLFEQWLTLHAPGKRDKVLNRIRAMRDGKLNDSTWDQRMTGGGIFAEQIRQTFAVACRKAGLSDTDRFALSTADFRRPERSQLALGL